MTSKFPSVIPPSSSNISPLPAPTTSSSNSSALSPSLTSSLPNQSTDPRSSSSSNSLNTSTSPTSSPPNETTDPLPSSAHTNSSSSLPQSPPPAASIAPRPSQLLSPPTALTASPASPPPSTPASLPPSPPASPPLLPTSPSPSAPAVPSTLENSPPSSLVSPPLQSSGSPPSVPPPPNAPTRPSSKSSPSPQIRSPPESASLPPPANVPTWPSSKSPPSPPARSPPESASPPSPANVPTRPSSKSPPSPPARSPPESASPPPPANVPTPPTSTSPPKSSSLHPMLTPPPSSSKSAPPPSPATTSSSTPTLSSPPPSVLSTSSPPTLSPPETPSTPLTTKSPSSSPLPSNPTEIPIVESTNGTSASASTSSLGKNGLGAGGAVAIGIVVGFVVLSLLVMVVWFAQKRKRKKARPKIGYNMPSPFASSQNSDSAFLRPQSPYQIAGKRSNSGFYSLSEPGAVNNSRRWFTHEELVQATEGFPEHNVLGEGGFGCVYKGILADGREVAVKQLKIGGGQGEREFRAEVEIIGRVHHRHLVSLVGYCISEQKRLLVYDYVPNNTLHYHLHGRGRPVMDWAVRVKVAAAAARGIAYLHEDCHPRIIHRDIKSSNILLDNNFDARVSDFGLAKLALDSNTHVTTRVMGTFGYMAPEYARSGKLTEKSDVFSFGVVLLELITGRKPVDDSQPLGDESLVEWARRLLAEAIEHQDFEELADPRLEKNYVDHEMFRMIEAAAACVRHSAAKRPKMSQVVRALNSMDESADLTNGMRPGQSEVFDSAQQSAQIRLFQRLAFGSQDYSSSSSFVHTQSSWRSREDGSQGSGRSREYGSHSDWSQEHREHSTLLP